MDVIDSVEMKRIALDLRMFLCDVDGVLTDRGIILDGEDGEFKRFDVQDGMGITLARHAGLKVGLITGRLSRSVKRRAEELKFDEICQGFFWKEEALDQILARHNLHENEVAYVGDDLLDLPVMRRVGFPIAVQNARPEVRDYCLYISQATGGHGAIREIIELLLDLRDQKKEVMDYFSKSRIRG